MNLKVMIGLLLPFFGTTAGSAMVYLLKNEMKPTLQKIMTGFAAGVMTAASFWSLLNPAMEQSSHLGKLGFIPATVGFLLGIGFLLLLDTVTPHMHMDAQSEGPSSSLKKTTKLILAVTLHNFPEGMAVGIVYAGWLLHASTISYSGALALAIGIAIQNFPEGAIISMPLRAEGMNKHKTFLYGVLSGIVEPIGAVITILFARVLTPVLPYFLSFAAGAMMYVVVEELIPEMSQGKHSNIGTVAYAFGFALMMVLDVALG